MLWVAGELAFVAGLPEPAAFTTITTKIASRAVADRQATSGRGDLGR
jgi:hypothetical protein